MQEEKLSIIKEDENRIEKAVKYNKSVYFLLPMIGLSVGVNMSALAGLINTYIGVHGDKMNFTIYILMKNYNSKVKSIKGFVREFEVVEGVMYEIKIPEKYEEDYLKFIAGKYSELSNDYKAQIYGLLTKPYRDTNVYKVLNKAADAKKILEDRIGMSIGNQEVLSIPSMDTEIYG